jgi:VIT1/CCC1 family predicted Fe2+/Mn2+ transporter
MSLRSAPEPFAARPWLSAVLALLSLTLGAVAISGLVPLSPYRWYFPGHAWLLAAATFALAAFFGYWAYTGMKSQSRPGRK